MSFNMRKKPLIRPKRRDPGNEVGIDRPAAIRPADAILASSVYQETFISGSLPSLSEPIVNQCKNRFKSREVGFC